MNNAAYGETVENVRKHVNIELVTKWEGRYGAEAPISKPNFHSRSIFSENLVAVELRKTEIFFKKAIYVGLSVLDISKTLIYFIFITTICLENMPIAVNSRIQIPTASLIK